MAASVPSRDITTEREAEGWMNDPYEYFGYHNTRIHSLPREHVEAVQLAAMNLRLEERRRQIRMLEKLADAQGVRQINSLDGLAPLLMPHDVYKSYPVSLLAKQQFGKLNNWLAKLTRHDPTVADVSRCDSIDSWLTKLRDETPLDVATSSGSSGTCSFFPKSKRDYRLSVMGLRVQLAQKFGEDPTPGDVNDKIHAIIPLYRDGHASTGAFAKYNGEIFARGDPNYWHTAFNFKISSDLMWLSARLRAAAAKGDASKVEVPASLLARRKEWEQAQKDMPAQQLEFVSRMIRQLQGQRVFVMSTSNLLYAAAKRGLDEGLSGVPSNDPFTTGAIARTMVDMAPEHPITKHLAVAYWRGGDEALEAKIYQPHHIEKICAWGGFASIKHVTKYIQPGIELISLDPKRSASIVGGEALQSEKLMQEAANRIATDVATGNQTACAACRMVYVTCGTDEDGVEKLKKLGQLTYDAMMRLPESLTTKPKRFDPELRRQVDTLRLSDDFYTVIGGRNDEGAVLVSHSSDRVEFWEYLADRTVNLIPVDTLEEVLDVVDAYTQTVGIFPEGMREVVRHKGALHGGQRFVSLGYAFNGPGLVGPQDGIEPMRRLVKWIISEEPLPGRVSLWEAKDEDIKVVA